MKTLALLGTLLVMGTASAENTYDGTGPLSDAKNWSEGTLPTPKAMGMVRSTNNGASGDFWNALGVKQMSGLLVDFQDKGLFLQQGSVYEIDDSRTNYDEYTNLDISGTLKLWSDKTTPAPKLRLLSGHVRTTNISLLKGIVGIKNGILHADQLIGNVGATINYLNDGSGHMIIEDKGESNLGRLFIDFQKQSRGSFTLGQKQGSAYSVVVWLIKNGRVSIGGKAVTNIDAFMVEKDDSSVTLSLLRP
jgi:hypothetical protein